MILRRFTETCIDSLQYQLHPHDVVVLFQTWDDEWVFDCTNNDPHTADLLTFPLWYSEQHSDQLGDYRVQFELFELYDIEVSLNHINLRRKLLERYSVYVVSLTDEQVAFLRGSGRFNIVQGELMSLSEGLFVGQRRLRCEGRLYDLVLSIHLDLNLRDKA